MNARGIGPKAAVERLQSDPGFKDSALQIASGKQDGRWNPRSADTLRLDYQAAKRRRKADAAFAEECDYWLPVFELMLRENIGGLEAMKRLRRI